MSDTDSRLRSARDYIGLSREKVAAVLGVSSKTIERWEARPDTVKRYQLVRLAELYEVPVETLEVPVAA